jgi:hypothetical protein
MARRFNAGVACRSGAIELYAYLLRQFAYRTHLDCRGARQVGNLQCHFAGEQDSSKPCP